MDSDPDSVPKSLLPEVFEFSIGAAIYHSCPVRWLPQLQVLEIGYEDDAKHVKVTAAQWRIFWLVLKHLKVWHWEHEYCDPTILDGTTWHLCIKYRGKKIESSGSNAYPGTKDIDFNADCDFGIFLAAVDIIAETNFSDDSEE